MDVRKRLETAEVAVVGDEGCATLADRGGCDDGIDELQPQLGAKPSSAPADRPRNRHRFQQRPVEELLTGGGLPASIGREGSHQKLGLAEDRGHELNVTGRCELKQLSDELAPRRVATEKVQRGAVSTATRS